MIDTDTAAQIAPWAVPTATVEGRSIPRLILGDNGFLRKYGSQLTVAEIKARMRLALADGAGLAAGDSRCLAAAARVAEGSGFVLHHTDARFRVDGRSSDFERCMATLAWAIARDYPAFLDDDPIMGSFLRAHSRYRPYEHDDELDIDSRALEMDRRRVRCHRPQAVSVGGDYLDALLVLDRADLVIEALLRWRKVCDASSALLIFTTYLSGWVSREVLSALAEPAAALMVPFNGAGLAMLPSATAVADTLAAVGRPVIAMHPLGSGRLQPFDALPVVFASRFVAAAVAGASTGDHIRTLLLAARQVLEP